ncbi:MAG: hypothetical protein J6Y02_10255 [Pseudobutyrivibrio sp.]|nr:hypothetical protein [Pseudobutyrivibrio sp.]
MCLEINLNKHPDRTPIILEKDLYVLKFLRVRKKILGHTIYETPVQRYRTRFIANRCILKAKFNFQELFYVFEGIHAFTSEVGWFLGPNIPFLAKIPKGTLVYFGINNDIVSEKLIIYKRIMKRGEFLEYEQFKTSQT